MRFKINTQKLKNILALSFWVIIISGFNSFAQNRYWVGGTGAWGNVEHWATTSGGPGGASIPTLNDNVIFDQNSFSGASQVIQIHSNAICKSIDFSKINQKIFLAGNPNYKLTIAGNVILSNNISNAFKGDIVFTSSSANTELKLDGVVFEGKVVFNGQGTWQLKDNFIGTKTAQIILERGNLVSNNNDITVGKFSTSTTNYKGLDLGKSYVYILNSWDFSNNRNIVFNAKESKLLFEEEPTAQTYQSGNLEYGMVTLRASSSCPAPGYPCATFTISLVTDSLTCNGSNDGTATVSAAGGSGFYKYTWQTPPVAGQTTAKVTGLPAGNYTVRVTDSITGQVCFCAVNVESPTTLNIFELSSVNPSCNGNCDGTSIVAGVGGTSPFSYLWAPGGYTTDTVTGLCAGTYTVQVTDLKGCTKTTTITLTAPAVLTAPGSFTNVKCFGVCDGTATVAPTGGTTPYSYNWTPGNPTGDGTNSVTGLCPGSYTCTVTDAKGCTASYTATITQPTVLGVVGSQVNVTCGGLCNGTATATVSGGTSTYTYVWSHGPTTSNTASLTNTVTGLCAGGYTVVVTDANNCTKSQTFTITEPTPLTSNISASTNVSCNGGPCDGTATVTAGGGTSPYTYLWASGGQTTASVTGLCAGTYTVTVTDVPGCTKTSTVTITQPTALSAGLVGTNIICNGACTGTATSTPSGGTSPYTYLWAPGGQTSSSLSNLCAGTYTVTVTDAKLCTKSQTVTIIEPTVITNTMSSTNASCNGTCDGTASVSASGGTSPYTYLWAPGGQTTSAVTGLCAGTYTVTTTDVNSCTKTSTVTISQPSSISVTGSSTALSCNGDCTSTLSTVVVGNSAPYSFLWAPGGQTTSSITNQCAGTYTVTVTGANGCTASTTINVTQPTAMSLNTNVTNVTCFGGCNGTLAAIAGGGTVPYTYLWAPGGQTTSSLTNQCAGSYTVTATDLNGCTKSAVLTITQPSQILPNASVTANLSCSGACIGAATSAPTGGVPPYTYSWAPGGQTTASISNKCAGTYTVTVTDASLCTATQTVTISQPTVLTAAIASSTSSCNICNGTATAAGAGGTPPYSYTWMPGGQTTQTATGLCPSITYTVTVKDANNCTATTSITVVQAITIVITTSNTTLSCNGDCTGQVTANATGGTLPYNFLWNPGGQTTSSLSNLCAGSYTVTVSDAVGCFSTASVTFNNPPLLTLSTSKTDVTCGGGPCNGTGTATAGGGTGAYTYLWMPGGQTTAIATGLCAGTYTCTLTDANNCTKTSTVTINQPVAVDDHENLTSPTCTFADGIIFVSPTGGTGPYTYLWGGGPGGPYTGQGTNILSNLLPGIYTLQITDNLGCIYNFTYLLSNLTIPATTMSKTDISCNTLCDGTASVSASGGTLPYTYDWTPLNPIGDGTPNISSLCAGTYTVQVTDFIGCIKFDTISIFEPAAINPNAIVTNESCVGSCNGSVVTATSGGTPGYTYLWAPGNQTTSSITGQCPATYTLTVTDTNGCTAVNNYTINSPTILSVSLASTNVLCNAACNGTATATPAGGTAPYTYSWSHNGTLTLPNVVNLCPGSYTVTVTDANLCTATAVVTITEPLALTATTSQTNISCNGLCDGIASVTPAGGTAPYTYSWNPTGATTPSISSLCSGGYIVTVTDSNGCVLTPPTINIVAPTIISPNATSTNPTCNGFCNGTATAAPTGGTGSTYTYFWSPGGQTTATITGLCAGSYTVVVTDSLGCTQNQTVTLTAPTLLTNLTSSISPSCANGCDGSVTSTPNGGTPGYSYLWSPGNITTQTATNLCSGTYTVIVTDANNCKDTQSVVITNTPAINALISTTTATCGVCNGTATINPTTGVGPYSYNWTPAPGLGQGTANGTQMCAGLYSVKVTDSKGCDSTFVIAINNSGGPTGSIDTINHATCYGVCNGSASVVAVGGLAPYTYLWNTTPAIPNDTALNLCAGNYFCQITDANNCIYNAPITINQPAIINPNAVITNATCLNICNGSITVTPTGGTGAGYTYSWAPGGQTTPTINNLCPGTYTLTTTDGNLCTKVDTFTVGQTSPLTATLTSSLINCANSCNGMMTVVMNSGVAPYLYQWNDPSNQTNDTASSLCAGIYSVSVTDSLGCIASFTDTVKSKPAIVANAVITNATCGVCDGQAVLSPSGGTAPYNYLWSNGDTTATADSLCAGLYTVNITDSLGCSVTASILISNTNGPSSAVINSTNISCNGQCNGAVSSVVPVGGTPPYTYYWLHNGATTASLSNLCAGTYYLQITDSLGCSLLDSVTISEPSPLAANQTVTAATCNVCDGAITIAPSGGTSPYSVLWNTSSTLLSLNNLCAGVYSVVITDNSGCTSSVSIPLNSKNGPTLSISSTDITCNGACNGIATVTATGGTPGYSYLWSPTSQTTPTATALCAGTYFAQVTDTLGCVSILSTTLTAPSSINFSAPSVSKPLCSGAGNGSITVIPNGGTFPYTYSWAPTSGSSATLGGLSTGTYTVTVTDANGCTATQSATMTQPTALAIINVPTNPSCSNVSNGAIDITVSGGAQPYSCQWSGASNSTLEDLSGLGAGTYIITVTDNNGCIIKDTITLTPVITVTALANNDTAFCSPGSMLLSVTSTNATIYQWFIIDLTGNTLVGSGATLSVTPPVGTNTYYALVDNGSGCTASDTVIVTVYPIPVVDAGNNVSIYPGVGTTIGGSPTGPAGSTYLWTPIPTLDNNTIANPVASPTVTTTYTVVVTSSNGCKASDTVQVIIAPQIVTVSGFTPNGDGVNDEWIIPNIELYPNCVVEVYNRWGELLFQSKGYKERWKGVFKGKQLPVGTYYYVINLNDPLFPDPYTGPITIMR